MLRQRGGPAIKLSRPGAVAPALEEKAMCSRLDAIPVAAAIWVRPASSQSADAEYFDTVEVDAVRARSGYCVEVEHREDHSDSGRIDMLLVRRLAGPEIARAARSRAEGVR